MTGADEHCRRARGTKKMTNNSIEFDNPGKFNATEEAILDYLYTHTDTAKSIGIDSLSKAPKPDRNTEGLRQQAYEEIQDGLETLALAGLISRKRVSNSGRVCFEKLRLTKAGEVAAIRERKRVKKFVVSVVY
jgi:hypothetical protein